MWTILTWAVALAVLGAVTFLCVVLVRAYRSGSTPSEILFRAKPEPRLQVVELANMDSRRKLVLIRRDDVEHLIMTGGPVDMVIETGIGEKKRSLRGAETFSSSPSPTPPPQPATVLTRPARTLGQGAGGGSGEGA